MLALGGLLVLVVASLSGAFCARLNEVGESCVNPYQVN